MFKYFIGELIMVMHETYVSIETSELLEKAGFDWDCRGLYIGNAFIDNYFSHTKNCTGYKKMHAPSLYVAQKWLREIKKISVEVDTDTVRWINRNQDGKYTVSYRYKLWPIDTSIVPADEDKFICHTIDYANNIEFPTYEQAFEAGIQECLTILSEEKK